MTTIRDPQAPTVKGEFRKVDNATAGRRLSVLIAASAVVLSAINLTASAYLWRSTNELRAIDERLRDIAGLEKRLKGSLDVINSGIQARLDNLDREMHNKITSVEDEVGKLQQVLVVPHGKVVSQPERLPLISEPWSPELAEPTIAEAANEPVLPASEPVRRKQTPPVSKVESAYQRTESPDGKVYYRRVR